LKKYKDEFKLYSDILIGGRLGDYKYYDMDQIIGASLNLVKKELK
jgi:UDP-galactopyranose mutase